MPARTDSNVVKREGWEGIVACFLFLISFPILHLSEHYMALASTEPKAHVVQLLYVTVLGFWIGLTFSGLRRPGYWNRVCSWLSLILVVLFVLFLILQPVT